MSFRRRVVLLAAGAVAAAIVIAAVVVYVVTETSCTRGSTPACVKSSLPATRRPCRSGP